jgi:hypothetical protein
MREPNPDYEKQFGKDLQSWLDDQSTPEFKLKQTDLPPRKPEEIQTVNWKPVIAIPAAAMTILFCLITFLAVQHDEDPIVVKPSSPILTAPFIMPESNVLENNMITIWLDQDTPLYMNVRPYLNKKEISS